MYFSGMKTISRLVIICICLLPSITASAWGMLGHRVTGEIAETYLSGKARKQIKAILGNESLAMASNWGDFIKSDPAYKYLDSWHYINFSKGLNYEQMVNAAESDTTPNAYNKLKFLISELKKKELPSDTKRMYLRLLIHITGDIHQPMHVSRAEDLGGNRIRLMWFNQPSNLHRVWDDHLPEYQNLSYTEYTRAINFTNKDTRKKWQAQPITEWLYESYSISAELYEEIKSPEQNLSYNYNFKHVETLNNRLLKGGVRLAGLLNEIFG